MLDTNKVCFLPLTVTYRKTGVVLLPQAPTDYFMAMCRRHNTPFLVWTIQLCIFSYFDYVVVTFNCYRKMWHYVHSSALILHLYIQSSATPTSLSITGTTVQRALLKSNRKAAWCSTGGQIQITSGSDVLIKDLRWNANLSQIDYKCELNASAFP